MTTVAGPASGHLPALDGLRAIAVLLVIAHNADSFTATHGWNAIAVLPSRMGWIGVQLFFVLSGFLITRGLLERKGAADYYRLFFRRRALRIFPLYFLTLTFFLVILPRLVALPEAVLATYRNQVPLWVFVNNWTDPLAGGVYWFSHCWSLAVEEQFYLVWPLVVATLAETRLLTACVVIAAGAVALRTLLFAVGLGPGVLYEWTVCRMDALAVGAGIAVIVRSAPAVRVVKGREGCVLLAAIALILSTGLLTQWYSIGSLAMMTLGYTALSFGFGGIVLVGIVGAPKGVVATLNGALAGRALQPVARYSYAMYLMHLPITLALRPRLSSVLEPAGALAPVLYTAAVMILTFLAAALSFFFVEKRLRFYQNAGLRPVGTG